MTFKATHNMTDSREYRAWQQMRERCSNPRSPAFKRYGGRGITVCDRWQKFEAFFEDMGSSNGLSIDRKDNNGNYEPGNCRWATRKEQANNHRANRRIEFAGETLTIQQLADRRGLRHDTLSWRLKHWPIERALA